MTFSKLIGELVGPRQDFVQSNASGMTKYD
jgi:hypothetical protein